MFERMMKGIVAAALLAGCAMDVAAMPADAVVRWKEDLRVAGEKFIELHPNAYGKLSPATMRAELAALAERLPSMEEHAAIVELARIIAARNDGHSRVTFPVDASHGFFQGHTPTPLPKNRELAFHILPIRLYSFEDGLFVTRTTAEHAELLGARLLAVGSQPFEEALALVGPIAHGDNAMQKRHIVAQYLVTTEVLHAVGLSGRRDEALLTFQLADGSRKSVTLRGTVEAPAGKWIDAARAAQLPLYRQRNDEPYWFDYLPADRTVYLQYNEVTNRKDESIDRFVSRLFTFINANPVERLIIDLRGNEGGDGGLARPLLHAIMAEPKLRKPGSLFAIVGRETFSAAMLFLVDLEKHTRVLFAGEPTGSRPNSPGDARKVLLPNSGVVMRVSTLYWQVSDPRDDREGIVPHLPAPLTSADFLAGRDPSMEAILSFARAVAPETIGGIWRGTLQIGYGRYPAELDFERRTLRSAIFGDAVQSFTFDYDRSGRLRFATPPSLTFEGQVTGSHLTGIVQVDGWSMMLFAEGGR